MRGREGGEDERERNANFLHLIFKFVRNYGNAEKLKISIKTDF